MQQETKSDTIKQIQQTLDNFVKYVEPNKKVVIRRFRLYNSDIKKEKKEIEEMLIKWAEPTYECINRGYNKWADLQIGRFFISFHLFWSYKDNWVRLVANDVIHEYQLKHHLNSPEEAYKFIKDSKIDINQDIRLMYV